MNITAVRDMIENYVVNQGEWGVSDLSASQQKELVQKLAVAIEEDSELSSGELNGWNEFVHTLDTDLAISEANNRSELWNNPANRILVDTFLEALAFDRPYDTLLYVGPKATVGPVQDGNSADPFAVDSDQDFDIFSDAPVQDGNSADPFAEDDLDWLVD